MCGYTLMSMFSLALILIITVIVNININNVLSSFFNKNKIKTKKAANPASL